MTAALASTGQFDAAVLFPDRVTSGDAPADDAAPRDDSEVDFDYSGVQWELPSDGDMEALETLAALVEDSASVAVGEDDDDVQAFQDFTPDDREWV